MAADERKSDLTPRREQGLDRPRGLWSANDPFRMLNRLAGEMDRVFEDFGLGRNRWFMPTWGETWPSLRQMPWMPDVEVRQQDHDLIVRVDLPGLKKDDVKVNVTDDAITIEGERKHEAKTEEHGIYRTERSYGQFSRTIPLPEGVIAEQAKASFDNGVLEIRMPAPPEQVSRGRQLEIQEGASTASRGGVKK